VVPISDYISSPSNQDLAFRDWSQASFRAANLFFRRYSSFPAGTYQNYAFPNLKGSVNDTIFPVGTKLLYATSLQVDGGVHPLNVTCKVLGPAGFRYTVGFNGLNDPESTSLEGAWYGGSPGDPYINFSHIDSAGYRCGYAEVNFSTSIVSFGVTLESNSSSQSKSSAFGRDCVSIRHCNIPGL
jgi:hypothetical protein